MGGTWGNKIKLSIFGESHGRGIGIVIDGIPPGIPLDFKAINQEMQRRAPGKDPYSTKRKEPDQPEILSGLLNEVTTGAPLAMFIQNTDTRSRDYGNLKHTPRPSHADYPGSIKYRGFNDYRGGGHFSGRLTAALVFAGAIAKQIVADKGIYIGAHIKQIGTIKDQAFDLVNTDKKILDALNQQGFPLLDKKQEEAMKACINQARTEGDSVGGKLECAIIGLMPGLGEPFFDSVESRIAHLAFSVPAVKGIHFGSGDALARMRGSEANDSYHVVEGQVRTTTNHNGGILGGITTGMPVVFETTIKPTPSISQEQQTIDQTTQQPTTLKIQGRHDPCIVQRAVVVIEAIAALAILDLL